MLLDNAFIDIPPPVNVRACTLDPRLLDPGGDDGLDLGRGANAAGRIKILRDQQRIFRGMLELHMIYESACALLDADVPPAKGASGGCLLVGVVFGVILHEMYPEPRLDIIGFE